MANTWFYYNPTSGKPIKDIPNECEGCIESCNDTMETAKCPMNDEKRRRGKVNLEEGTLYICTNAKVESARIFKEKRRVYKSALKDTNEKIKEIRKEIHKNIERHIHNLINIHTESLQEIYSLIPQRIFWNENIEDILDEIEGRISGNERSVAESIFQLLKNEKKEKAEFTLYEKLYGRKSVSLDDHKIHQVVLSALNSFDRELGGKDISIVVEKSQEEVKIDYEVLSAVLVNLFDNAKKYIRPDTELHINFDSDNDRVYVDLSMVSLKVEDEEVEKIWEQGFSGSHPEKINRDGQGLGLHIATHLLEMINADIELIKDVDQNLRASGPDIEFQHNIFRLTLPKA